MLDLSHKQDLAWLAQLVADLREVAPALQPLLVGALARDLILHYGYGIRIERATTDTDLALAVADWQQFAVAREALVASGLFEPYRDTLHKLRHRKSGWVDLIPFGAVERADGSIAWPPSGDDVMIVTGYAEADAAALAVLLPQNCTARVVSLPMLAVLKILAWKDRHLHTRGKDAVDLALLLRRYLDAGNAERLYAELLHVMTENFDYEQTGAWLLGRDARAAMLKHSARFETLVASLEAVLAPELDPEGALALVSQLNAHDPGKMLGLLAMFHTGLLGLDIPAAK